MIHLLLIRYPSLLHFTAHNGPASYKSYITVSYVLLCLDSALIGCCIRRFLLSLGCVFRFCFFFGFFFTNYDHCNDEKPRHATHTNKFAHWRAEKCNMLGVWHPDLRLYSVILLAGCPRRKAAVGLMINYALDEFCSHSPENLVCLQTHLSTIPCCYLLV